MDGRNTLTHLDGGRPKSGHVANLMRRRRVAYHYAVRQTKRNEDDVIRDRLANALISNRNRDL